MNQHKQRETGDQQNKKTGNIKVTERTERPSCCRVSLEVLRLLMRWGMVLFSVYLSISQLCLELPPV